MAKSWRIVGFKHPTVKKSILYQQDISEESLIRLLKAAIKDGANLFSIRGFEKNG